jgi:hypothetical protein
VFNGHELSFKARLATSLVGKPSKAGARLHA